MEQVFELRKEHKNFDGGVIGVGSDGKSIDLGKELAKAPKGKIVTSDPLEIDALRQVPALKAVEAKKTKSRSRKRTAKTAAATGQSTAASAKSDGESTTPPGSTPQGS